MKEVWVLTMVVQGIERSFVFFDFEKAKQLFDALNDMARNPTIPSTYIDVDVESFFFVTRQGLGFVSLEREYK